MIGRLLIGVIILPMWFTGTAHAETKLQPVHPDEPAQYTYHQRFSLDGALSGLQRIRTFLESFRKLTGEAKGKISQAKLQEIGHTDWETQYLGFDNLVKSLEGTLRKQDLLIKKLQYQLAEEQMKKGTGEEKALEEARKAYEESARVFQEFWEKFRIKD